MRQFVSSTAIKADGLLFRDDGHTNAWHLLGSTSFQRDQMQTQTEIAPQPKQNAIVSLPIIESCEGCGSCCLEQESPPGYLWILINGRDMNGDADSEDVRRFNAMPESSRLELESYRAALVAGFGHPNEEICLWFDERTRQCKHYELRPEICRSDLLLGDEACRRWRDKYFRTN